MSRRRTTKPIITAVLVFAAVIILHSTGLLRPVTDPVVRGVLVLASPFHKLGKGIQHRYSKPSYSADQINTILADIDRLRRENAKLHNVLDANVELKAALGFREKVTDSTLLSRVVSESAGDTFRGIVIDRGEVDGVLKGQPVLTADGILIGKVYDVKQNTASVQLLTDTMSRLAITIQNGSRTIGVLEGERGLSMKISLIPHSEVISPGDILVTSGAEPGIRRGIPIGIIEKVSRETQDPFQTALISAFNSTLHPAFVQVIIGNTKL